MGKGKGSLSWAFPWEWPPYRTLKGTTPSPHCGMAVIHAKGAVGLGVPPNPTWCGHNSPHGVLSLFVLFCFMFFFFGLFCFRRVWCGKNTHVSIRGNIFYMDLWLCGGGSTGWSIFGKNAILKGWNLIQLITRGFFWQHPKPCGPFSRFPTSNNKQNFHIYRRILATVLIS